MYIYLVQNNINGKIYIGQSSKDSMKTRSYYGSGKIIKKSILKNGKSNFTKFILVDNIKSRDELNNLEIFYISLFQSRDKNIGYNIAIGGNGNRIELWKSRISKNLLKIHSKLWKNNISKALKGHKHSIETKKKISLSKKGKKCKNRTIDIVIFDSDNNVVYTVNGYFRDFCKKHNLPVEVLIISYRNNGKRLYQNLSSQKLGVIRKNGNIAYQGWYAKYKKDEK